MFERFNDRARNVIVLAQGHARDMNHNYIGTEHILLGVTSSEGGLPPLLAALGITTDYVKAKVIEIVGQGGSSPSGHIPFTPRAKKVMELSLREALTLGHNYIGIEHLVLALIREREGIAAQAMESTVPLANVRQAVIQYLGSLGGETSEAAELRVQMTWAVETEVLTSALRSYNMVRKHLGPGPHYVVAFFDAVRKRRGATIDLVGDNTVIKVINWIDRVDQDMELKLDHPLLRLRTGLANYRVVQNNT